MRNRMAGLGTVLAGALLFSLPAAAQVYYPGSAEQRKAAEGAKAPAHNPRDFSGIWRRTGQIPPPPKGDTRIGDAHGSPLMGGAPPPPMTTWAQAILD
jgi:hypothetical protein